MVFFRTAALLGLLTGIFLVIGYFLGGTSGLAIGLIFAFLLNFVSFWYSDKIVLKLYGAKPSKDRKLNDIVEKLSLEAGISKPNVYVVNSSIANAFATGRSPKNATVAATQGLLDNLSKEEIEAVLAHEIAHVKNRDTLISTMAATVGGAISFLAQMAWWGVVGGNRRQGGGLILLPLLLLAPLAAMLIRMAISRGREYSADYTGALITKKPLALVSALVKISNIAKQKPLRGNAGTAHLWIVNPLRGDGFVNLFSTHPPMKERIKRLKSMEV